MANDFEIITPPKGLAIEDAILSLDKGQAFAFPASHKSSLTSRISALNRAHRPRHWRTRTDRPRFLIYIICEA